MLTLGIDEVGRGCWAGPVTAGAVILSLPIDGLKDSKKLTKKQREELTLEIKLMASAVGIGWAFPSEIDSLGLTEAVRLAMLRALNSINIAYDEIVIDGNYNFFSNMKGPAFCYVKTIIGADNSVPSVSAASIIAKTARDEYMTKQALKFPDYGFEKHVGYGTKQHIDSLRDYGPCKLHRLSYKPLQVLIQ